MPRRVYPISLSKEWFSYIKPDDVSENVSGIYEWHIDGKGSYIGKYKSIRRPKTEYSRNVQNLLNDFPYRKNNKTGFRMIHRALREAVFSGTAVKITLYILENHLHEDDRSEAEQELIKNRGVLNRPMYGNEKNPKLSKPGTPSQLSVERKKSKLSSKR